jgi:inner membrane protein involved in colicin E2 resistance
VIKRIAAIAFIFVCTTVAWMILGGTIFSRTYSADQRLEGRVASSWGTTQTQAPPTASYWMTKVRTEEVFQNNQRTTRKVADLIEIRLPLESSRINVGFHLDHRQKGLLWYSTYAVDFSGAYGIRNTSAKEEAVTFRLKFPAAQAVYDNLTAQVDGQSLPITTDTNGAMVTAKVPAGKLATAAFAYRSQGMGNWTYKFGDQVSQVSDFVLNMKTNFKAVDVPPDTLSPTEKHEVPDGWDLTWKYKNLLSGLQIGMTMPEKLQPGPLAGEISFFAPVSLFFFFFLMFIITTLRGIDLHPMNYFFLATAFFAFHLLMAYLVDHISIHWAFVICSLVSIFLVISYLRLVVGMRFAAVEAGTAQLIYLVLFSYAFFFKGFTGLAITIGSIVTLFVVMQMTGRIKWAEKFAAKPAVVPPAFSSGGFHD